nr:putative uncharacterized protein DDB_G0279653 [Ipomoea batatas]
MNEQQAASMMNQQQQQHMMCMSQGQMMNINPHQQQIQQPPMMNRKYGMWPQPPHQPIVDQSQLQFNPNAMKHQGFMAGNQSKPLGPRKNWKGKKVSKNDNRRKEKSLMVGSTAGIGNASVNGGLVGASAPGSYQPPTLNELQWQNRLKARKFFPKKKMHNNYNNNGNNNSNNRTAPYAPRNTTSFLIRAKKSGGIASLVSPYPVTPAVLPTPILSPSREVLVDMAKEEWGVDGYGSMKGLIRLRSPGQELEHHEDDEEDQGGSSESDVEEHVEVERRLDHDLSRFEMIYPNCGEYNNVLENRVDDQDTHIAQLEEENLILKERLFLMESELGDLRRRLQSLERHNHSGEDNEEVVENDSENDSGSHADAHSMEDNNLELVAENIGVDVKGKLDTIDKDIKSSRRMKNDMMETEHWNHEIVEAAKTKEIAAECESEKIDEDLEGKEVNKQQNIEVKEDVDLEGKDVNKQQGIEVKEERDLEGKEGHKQHDGEVKEDGSKPKIEASNSVAAEDVNMLEACRAEHDINAQMQPKNEAEGNE